MTVSASLFDNNFILRSSSLVVRELPSDALPLSRERWVRSREGV
jgi:hypothetical protein